MKFRYFVAEGPEAQRIAAEGLELVNQDEGQMVAIIERFGADTAWTNRTGIVALAWKAEEGEKPADRTPFRYDSTEWSGDTRYYLYKPDRRTKAGKEAAKFIGSFKRFNFSDYATKAFNVSAWVAGSDGASRTGMSMFLSSAGYVKNQLVFRIPVPENESLPDRFPAIPECFREIKHSEFIAITEE